MRVFVYVHISTCPEAVAKPAAKKRAAAKKQPAQPTEPEEPSDKLAKLSKIILAAAQQLAGGDKAKQAGEAKKATEAEPKAPEGPWPKNSVVRYRAPKTNEVVVARILGFIAHKTALRARLVSGGLSYTLVTSMMLDAELVDEGLLDHCSDVAMTDFVRRLDTTRRQIKRLEETLAGAPDDEAKFIGEKIGKLRVVESQLVKDRTASVRNAKPQMQRSVVDVGTEDVLGALDRIKRDLALVRDSHLDVHTVANTLLDKIEQGAEAPAAASSASEPAAASGASEAPEAPEAAAASV